MAAHALAAAAVFTHPHGAFASAGLLLTMLWIDRNRVRPLTFAMMAAPYLLLGLISAIYGLQPPSEFAAQLSANSAARTSDALVPWRGVWREIMGVSEITSYPRAVWESLN